MGATRRPASCRRSTRWPAGCASSMPVQQGVSIAHGDYRFGNCLTDVAHGPHRGGARLGAVHAGRSARRRRLPGRVLVRRRRRQRAGQRPHAGRRVPAPTPTCSSATPPAPAATCRASTTTSRSAAGGSRSSARACTPATCTARWATGGRRPRVVQGRAPRRSPSERSPRCGGCRERQRPQSTCWRGGSSRRSPLPGSPATCTAGAPGPASSWCTRSPASRRRSPQFANDVVDAGFTVLMPSLVGTPGSGRQRPLRGVVDGQGVHLPGVHARGRMQPDVADHRVAAGAGPQPAPGGRWPRRRVRWACASAAASRWR